MGSSPPSPPTSFPPPTHLLHAFFFSISLENEKENTQK